MRDRAQPAPAQLSGTRRRRARGLRREEVAVAAGISATWYTWLEQGRGLGVSEDTLAAIVRALGLSKTEERHLIRLAAATRTCHTPITATASEALRSLVIALAPHPAYAVNGHWDVLCSNEPAATLLGAFDARPGRTDNILRRLFLDADWRTLFEQWELVSDAAVAQFRAETAHMTGDAGWMDFLSRLSAESSEFASCWSRQNLAEPRAREKIIRHPVSGRVRLLYASVAPDSEPADVRVIFYSAESAP